MLALGSGCGSSSEQVRRTPAQNLSRTPGEDLYVQGVALCCAKGEGESCCADYPELEACARHGGIYGACIEAGQEYEAKITCAHCCAGLAPETPLDRDSSGSCQVSAPTSVFVCLSCGNGTCDSGENSCNCPNDC